MVTGGHRDVLWGDIPAVQGGRLVAAPTDGSYPIRAARLCCATALACILANAIIPSPGLAQDGLDNFNVALPDSPSGSQMLIEADTLVYDNDNETVTAVGGVQIDYAGHRLVAQRVTYNRRTGRLVASGNVQLIDRSGTKVFAEEIDITDDFANGFVNALRIETVDKTYFAAESAERKDGSLTTFNQGVYTACEPCEEKPDKAPIWRIKARKIIWNGKEKTVRFENSRFEFFGMPIAFLPAFEIADPTVKRKSGFLIPGASYKSELGVGVSVPYYFALSPTFDATVTGHYYTKQGFLGEAEWRQKFNRGEYSLKIAGINQKDPGAFRPNRINSGTAADPNKLRGMVGTKGKFNINPRWTFGWDILVQSDKNFSYTYEIDGFNKFVHTSEIYLTGLDGRNYFDLHAYKFNVQEDLPDSIRSARNAEQPWVLPSLDYAYTVDRPVAGGELNIDVNSRLISRDGLDATRGGTRVAGPAGDSGRLTAEMEWKRSLVTDHGMVVTPLLALRGDVGYTDYSMGTLAAIQNMGTTVGVASGIRDSFTRFMATAGLELRWPVLFSSANASHVVEPMAQVFARPDEQHVNGLEVPNEDAQSFVFDASSLFERDKFSGFDRIEGGTRVNVGLRYAGTFGNGWTANGLLGQSYQIAGTNSFAQPDLVNAGAFSGLETPTSDFVGLFGFTTPHGFSASASSRLDEKTLDVRRAELKAGLTRERISVTGKYAFIQAQPLYGFPADRHEVTLAGSLKVHEFWRVFASGTYDFQSSTLVRDAVGFAYDDECFTYAMTFSEQRHRITREVTQSVGFNISFRTLGDFGSGRRGAFPEFAADGDD
jgi:LPS-assembly protein